MNISLLNFRSGRALSTAIFLSACAFLSACDSTSTIATTSDGMVVSLPTELRDVRAVRTNDLQLQVSVNGNLIRTVPVADQDEVSLDIQIPDGQANEITLSWFAVIDNQTILLADITRTVSDSESEIAVSNYNSTGDRFDEDEDGRTNLSEVRDKRNPLSEIDLEVPLSNATFLPANTTITNDGIDGNTSGDPKGNDLDSRFSLWHDGSNLNLYVCGQDQVLSESSDQYWHDDTVFVFIDGADSDSATYDGVDDYQIAFVRSTEELIVSKGSGNAGCGDGSCITFSFFNNSSSCQYELSASFSMASMNMTPGENFGFDIEFTDDDNGGLREDSSAWIGFNDSSDVDPRTFGTAQLR